MATVSVLFFASLREAMGTSKLQIDLDALAKTPADIAAIRQHLLELEGTDDDYPSLATSGDRNALKATDVVCALNQTVCDSSAKLSDGDEVAFFPPVTGG